LIDGEMLVEIEADAIVPDEPPGDASAPLDYPRTP
jgi:hypothetical protein